ncbi:MAG TPA: methionine biosynthesis protein MetW [Porticoccaceae bacterium]|jgi:methionine biosynthesis protein MetW|nr:methionine biosynthesis protein MetW [Porticoccaceae bacterium]
MTDINSIIEAWVEKSSRVLDLGCGDGQVLESLIASHQVHGYGLEINSESINHCISRGLNVIEQDLNEGLGNFADNSFDSVLMTQTLQTLRFPHLALDEMLRIGRQCIVTFPNFGHWRTRGDLGFRGRMPVTKQLVYQWYDTPNIHFFTYKDFEVLCAERNINVVNRVFIGGITNDFGLDAIWPNLFAHTAVYNLSK